MFGVLVIIAFVAAWIIPVLGLVIARSATALRRSGWFVVADLVERCPVYVMQMFALVAFFYMQTRADSFLAAAIIAFLIWSSASFLQDQIRAPQYRDVEGWLSDEQPSVTRNVNPYAPTRNPFQPAEFEKELSEDEMKVLSSNADSQPDCNCTICGDSLDEAVVYCYCCLTAYHKECWKYIGRCSVYGCSTKRYRKQPILRRKKRKRQYA